MRYRVIYADPPWKYDFSKSKTRSIESKYPTMSLEELQSLDIASIAEDNSVLMLWITFPKLNWLFPLLVAWGFVYRTVGFVWVKANEATNMLQSHWVLDEPDDFETFTGLGYYTRSNAEICIIATRGKGIKRKSSNVRQVVYSPVQKHSAKPEIIKEYIVKLFGDVSRIELFSRKKTVGWDCVGNDIDGEDIRVSLQKWGTKVKNGAE